MHISRGTVTQLDAVHLLTKKIRQTEVEPQFWKLQQNKMENLKAELIMSSSKPSFITELNEQPRYLLLPPLFLCVILSFNKHLHFLSRRGHFGAGTRRSLPCLPGLCGCCSKCCCQPAWSDWPSLRSDNRSPTTTLPWHARLCFVSASSRLP